MQRLQLFYLSDVLRDMTNIFTRTPAQPGPGHRAKDPYTLKKGPLTPSEMARIARHPELGDEMLINISPFFKENLGRHPQPPRALGTARAIPTNLAGEDIPFSGRILAVCDVFDAITSERSYRDPMQEDEALQTHRAGNGQGL